MGRPLQTMLAVIVVALALAPAASAANDDYDNLNGVTLGDTPYTSVMPFVPPMQNFNNSTFDAAPEYAASPEAYAGCAAWGWRSAWVRFATAVKGRVFVSVDSSAAPARDVFYNVYIVSTSIPPGSASMSQLTETACHNSNHGPPNEDYSFGHEIPANQTIYVQVMSVCADSTLQVDIMRRGREEQHRRRPHLAQHALHPRQHRQRRRSRLARRLRRNARARPRVPRRRRRRGGGARGRLSGRQGESRGRLSRARRGR